MTDRPDVDYYEVLQVSPNAAIDTIHRIYRILAQRCHPDNQQTGDAGAFRLLSNAYHVLSAPETRAQYDAVRRDHVESRGRLISEAVRAHDDVHGEGLLRLALLEVLYARRRMEPRKPGVFYGDLEELTGRPREHLEFTLWYLEQKKLVARDDGSRLVITWEGVDHLEAQSVNVQAMRRLAAAQPAGCAA